MTAGWLGILSLFFLLYTSSVFSLCRARSGLLGPSAAIDGDSDLSLSSEPLKCSVPGSFYIAIAMSYPNGHKLGPLTQPIALDKLWQHFLLWLLTSVDAGEVNKYKT